MISSMINESLNTDIVKVKEIISLLNSKGIKVSKKEDYYNGSGYRERYSIIGSDDIDGYTSYSSTPIKVKSHGFITKDGILQNFFYHTGERFEITKDINTFLISLENK